MASRGPEGRPHADGRVKVDCAGRISRSALCPDESREGDTAFVSVIIRRSLERSRVIVTILRKTNAYPILNVETELGI